MGVFHWSRPYNQLYDSRVSLKHQGRKSRKKQAKTPPRQDIVHPGLFGSRSQPDLETTRTNCKPLTNKLYQVKTSLSDLLTRLEQCPHPPLRSWVGIKPTLCKPLLAAVTHHLSFQRSQLHYCFY